MDESQACHAKGETPDPEICYMLWNGIYREYKASKQCRDGDISVAAWSRVGWVVVAVMNSSWALSG